MLSKGGKCSMAVIERARAKLENFEAATANKCTGSISKDNI